MKIYLFFREGGWYPIQLKDDEEAIRNAESNKGTIMVRTIDGEVIWSNLLA